MKKYSIDIFKLSCWSFLLLTLGCNPALEDRGGGSGDYYKEQHRPKFHFTPEKQWMNDPNGMVYYEGEYHLFYQHYPDSNVWGPMHWGHAVSEDLVHWQHLPIGIYPDSMGYIFSGSCVIDYKNTSGFGTENQIPMVAIFTIAVEDEKEIPQRQGIAYSLDKGRTWTKYEGNPVIDEALRAFRDPKVFWHEPTASWIMSIAATTDNVGIRPDHIRFYASPDLKSWKYLSEFGHDVGSQGGKWECPDLFEMPIEGTNETKWVLLVSINPGGPNGGSATQYFVGDFDGQNFILDENFSEKLGNVPAQVPEGEVFADFEGDNYGGWKATGKAFGSKPANGTLEAQNAVTAYVGKGLVNTFLGGDDSMGQLNSPTFEIKSNYINFLIGGGNHPQKTCINLLVDGKVVHTATGGNDERLHWQSWEVSKMKGKKASIEIVDQQKGGWGHINIDQITFADSPIIPAYNRAVWLDYGRDNYAGVTWSNIPEEDGRRLFIGWMSNWDYATLVPTTIWRSAMTVVRELTLEQIDGGLSLCARPVKEQEKLRMADFDYPITSLNQSYSLKQEAGQLDVSNMEFDIEVELPQDSKAIWGLEWKNELGESYKIAYDAGKQQLFSDRRQAGKKDFASAFAVDIHYAPVLNKDNVIRLHGLVDVASIELFANNGSTVMTEIFFPNEDFNDLNLFIEGGTAKVKKMKIYSLESIW